MNIRFNQTNNHMHEIFINDKKAGLLCLLHPGRGRIINEYHPEDWRVFFWGKYSKYQVHYSVFGFNSPFQEISLISMKELLTSLVNNNPKALFPDDQFHAKGHVLVHTSNGDILSVNNEYGYRFTEYFSIKGKDIVFGTEEKLKEIVSEIIKKDGDTMWYGEVLRTEYIMLPSFFDISYID